MKLYDIKNINYPTKINEEFKKIDLDSLYNYDFKNIKNYEIDFKTTNEKKVYSKNEFNKINQNLSLKNYELNIKTNTKEPTIIVHILKDDETLYTNTLNIIIQKNVVASIVELFFSNSNKNNFYSVNRTFTLEENSTLNYLKYQDFKEFNSIITNSIIILKNNATIEHTNFEIGNGLNLNIYESSLDGTNSNININGLVKLNKNAKSSSIFNIIHNKSNNSSNVNYRHSLEDNSKAVFEAKTIVSKTASFSKVFQNSNTILLSDDSTMFAKPHLEISIDELEASHSSTIGSLDDKQLLYLCSRGIEKEHAKKMLLNAFENIICNNIKNEKIKKFINNFKRSDYV